MAENAYSQPMMGPFAGFDASKFFGAGDPGNMYNSSNNSPFGFGERGQGAYGLPDAFTGWEAGARYSFLPALQYAQGLQPAIQHYQGALGKDWSSDLYGQSADAINAQFRGGRRLQDQSLARAGYRGGATTSPFAAFQIQQEAAARSGQLGNAARMSVLQAQQMKDEAARGLQNTLASQMQALLAPAQFQSSISAKVPTQAGPSLLGPSMNLLSSFFNAAA